MAAIRYSDPLLAVLTNYQLIGEERAGAKFQINISKIEGLERRSWLINEKFKNISNILYSFLIFFMRT